MTALGKTDKVQLIEARFRQLEYRQYGLELDLIVENAKANPDADSVQVIENAIAEIDTQIAALNSELTAVNSLPE
jgi:hypothetical protein